MQAREVHTIIELNYQNKLYNKRPLLLRRLSDVLCLVIIIMKVDIKEPMVDVRIWKLRNVASAPREGGHHDHQLHLGRLC